MKQLALSIFICLLYSSSLADSVYVKSSQNGRGETYYNGEIAYIITPLHVVGDENRAEIIHNNGAATFGTVKRRIDDIDVAVIEPDSPDLLSISNEAFAPNQNIIDLIKQNQNECYIQYRAQDGSVRNQRVYIRKYSANEKYFQIEKTNSDSFIRNLSGSTVKTDGQVIGMLTNVDANNPRIGIVLRQDVIAKDLDFYLATQTSKAEMSNLLSEIQSNSLGTLDAYVEWKILSEKYPNSIAIAKHLSDVERKLEPAKESCQNKQRKDFQALQSLMHDLSVLADTSAPERNKSQLIAEAFKKHSDEIREIWGTSDVDRAREKCGWVEDTNDPDELPPSHPYSFIRTERPAPSYKKSGFNKYSVRYERVFKNHHESKAITCRYHASSASIRRGTQESTGVGETDTFEFTLKPGQTRRISGKVTIKLQAPGTHAGFLDFLWAEWN